MRRWQKTLFGHARFAEGVAKSFRTNSAGSVLKNYCAEQAELIQPQATVWRRAKSDERIASSAAELPLDAPPSASLLRLDHHECLPKATASLSHYGV